MTLLIGLAIITAVIFSVFYSCFNLLKRKNVIIMFLVRLLLLAIGLLVALVPDIMVKKEWSEPVLEKTIDIFSMEEDNNIQIIVSNCEAPYVEVWVSHVEYKAPEWLIPRNPRWNKITYKVYIPAEGYAN